MHQRPYFFAVLFTESDRSQPCSFARKEIVQFIQRGNFFTKEPKYKPAATSAEIDAPEWFALEICGDPSTDNFQIARLHCNHYPNEFLKEMAKGLLMDVQGSKRETLLQMVADSTDVIYVHVDPTTLTPECRQMLNCLKAFLAARLHGFIFEPAKGFFDVNLRSLLTFSKKSHFFASIGARIFGNPRARGPSLAISVDAKTVGTTGSPGNKASLWDVRTGELISVLAGHKKPTRSIVFSPDGITVATGSNDKSIILWNKATGGFKKVLLGHTGIVGSLAVTPDGHLLASGGYDGKTILWDLPEGKKRSTISVHGRSVMGLIDGEKWYSAKPSRASPTVCSVAFSPDGRLLASGGTDGTVRIVDVESSEIVRTLEGYAESAWPVVFSPDGALIAAGSYDGKVRIWNVDGGKLVGTLGDIGNYVFGLAFSPDGLRIATGSTDTLVRIWDLQKRKRICTFVGHREAVEDVAFFPDGKSVVSASHDGAVRIWTVE